MPADDAAVSKKHRSAPDDPGALAVLDRLRQAWDAADATAFARCFTEDATFIIWRGDVLTGRAEIQAAHHELFSRHPTTMRVRAVDTRRLDEHTAVLVTVGGIGADSAYDMLQTCVMIRHKEGWLVAAFQNTAMSDRSKQRYRDAPGG